MEAQAPAFAVINSLLLLALCAFLVGRGLLHLEYQAESEI